MPGIHSLEHIECFFAAHLADHDSIGTHTQAVDDQLPLTDCPFAFDIGWAGFQTDDVLLPQLQFGRVFDRNDRSELGM